MTKRSGDTFISGRDKLFEKLRAAAAGILALEDVKILGEWFNNEGVIGFYEVAGTISVYIRVENSVSYYFGKQANLNNMKKLVRGIVAISQATAAKREYDQSL